MKLFHGYTRQQISEKCGVTYRTVLNWIKFKTFPLWALEKLDIELKRVKKW